MNIPSDLTAVFMDVVTIFGIGLEIHNGPGRVFKKCQVNNGIKYAGDVILDQNRKFAMAAVGLPCAAEHWMLQRCGHSLSGPVDFFFRGVQQPRMYSSQTKNGFRLGGEINIPQNQMDQGPEPRPSRAQSVARDSFDLNTVGIAGWWLQTVGRGKHIQACSATTLNGLLASRFPRFVANSSRRRFRAVAQHFLLPNAEASLNVEVEQRRIPPRYKMCATIGRVQAGLN